MMNSLLPSASRLRRGAVLQTSPFSALRLLSLRATHLRRQAHQGARSLATSNATGGTPSAAVVEINDQIEKLKIAQEEFLSFNQEKVDHIFQHVAHEAAKARVPLARLAVQETRLGAFEDKVVKNGVACELPLSRYLHAKTVGIIDRNETEGLTKIAVPKGPIASILPTTNPTSTAILKSLFALKTRNSMIFLPHPRAAKSTAEAVRIVHDAAVAAGAPKNVIQCVTPSKEASHTVLHHPDIRLILATGGPGMVKASCK